jgi:predicted Zn-dependent protease
MRKKVLFRFTLASCLLAASGMIYAQQQAVVDERLAHLTPAQLKLHYISMEGMNIYRDKKLDAYIDKVGQRVLASSDHAGQHYAFVIRDNPMPGAHVIGIPVVYIERGLFAALNSEAELAAIIGHEIGHNVGKHGVKSIRKRIGTNVLSTLASLMAGNSAVGSAIRRQAQVTSSSRRREDELEADRYGIEYSYLAGYDPAELISSLSQVFDVSKMTLGIGAGKVTHHGLRATHPREDIRLRAVVEDSSKLAPGEGFIGRSEFRQAIDGVLFGPNYADLKPVGWERYSNKTLGITFLYPDSWVLKVSGAKIVLKDAEETAQLKISIEKVVDKKQGSLDALKAKYSDLVGPVKIHPESPRDLGTLGARPGQRVALVRVARNTFHFQGIAKNKTVTPEQDKVFVEMIRSFRRMTQKDIASKSEIRIFYQRLKPGETFASLAKESVGFAEQDVESVIRVLNGYYPKGHAEPGTWIKMLRKEKIED